MSFAATLPCALPVGASLCRPRGAPGFPAEVGLLCTEGYAGLLISSIQRSCHYFGSATTLVRHARRAYSGLGGTIDLTASVGFGSRLRLYRGLYPSVALSLFLYQLDV